jgi:hypothetical protein
VHLLGKIHITRLCYWLNLMFKRYPYRMCDYATRIGCYIVGRGIGPLYQSTYVLIAVCCNSETTLCNLETILYLWREPVATWRVCKGSSRQTSSGAIKLTRAKATKTPWPLPVMVGVMTQAKLKKSNPNIPRSNLAQFVLRTPAVGVEDL